MYKLTLTRDERKAIDWIGDRYSHGDTLATLLMDGQGEEHPDWDGPNEITFDIPEGVAWQISDAIQEDGLACFGPELRNKLYAFGESIV